MTLNAPPDSPIVDALAPSTDAFTSYDEQHFALYLTLLQADADGWSDHRMCQSVLRLDPALARSIEILRSHLARARWLSRDGSHQLLAISPCASR